MSGLNALGRSPLAAERDTPPFQVLADLSLGYISFLTLVSLSLNQPHAPAPNGATFIGAVYGMYGMLEIEAWPPLRLTDAWEPIS